MTDQAGATAIRLATPNFMLRTVERADVGLRWAAWLADPMKTRTLNTKPLSLSVEEIQQYLSGFDGHNSHILGIFERSTDAMIGFWEVYVDWNYREFMINILIGERGRASRNAREETQWALLKYFFDELHLDAMRCTTLSTNTLVVRLLLERGAVHEHTSRNDSATGGAPVELLHFRFTKDTWAIRKKLRQERERAAGQR
ncbi:MAG: GNAT family N-acetyltransferase [Micropepsaceae bacterium]